MHRSAFTLLPAAKLFFGGRRAVESGGQDFINGSLGLVVLVKFTR